MRRHSVLLLISCILLATTFASTQKAGMTQGYPMPGLPGISIAQGLNASGRVQSLLVYQNGEEKQELDLCTPEPVPIGAKAGSLGAADLNFDGAFDLLFQVSSDHGNERYCVWLFDRNTQRFVPENQLSGLPNITPDPETRTLQSYDDQGCNNVCYTKTTYRWSREKLLIMRSETQTRDPFALGWGGCNYIRSISELRNGELREVKRDRVNVAGVPCH